ncbi:MAG: EVE domain-containing protein [Bryobacteraceae bacterium]|nr:EVE domain-containing protein [Bryobacteraceae bacterium]
MRYFLLKTDPGTYSAADLERDRRTVWDGVTNPQAVRCIREMKPGDRAFIYHSGGESAIVALAKIVSDPRPDPANPKSWVVDVEFVRRVDPPAALKEIKASGQFNDWALIRQGRLSTMEVPEAFLAWMRARYPSMKL